MIEWDELPIKITCTRYIAATMEFIYVSFFRAQSTAGSTVPSGRSRAGSAAGDADVHLRGGYAVHRELLASLRPDFGHAFSGLRTAISVEVS